MLETIKRYALASTLVSATEEDNVTAIELCGAAVRKVNECVKVLNELCDKCENIINSLGLNVENEELTISLLAQINQVRDESAELAACTSSAYNTDAMTALELAGCTSKHVNECARLINEMSTNMATLEANLGLEVANEELTIKAGV